MRKSLALFRDLKFDYPIAKLLAFLSGPVAARGFPEHAARLLGASEALLKAMGAGLQPPDQPEIDRFKAAVREKLDEETFKAAWAKDKRCHLSKPSSMPWTMKISRGWDVRLTGENKAHPWENARRRPDFSKSPVSHFDLQAAHCRGDPR